MPPDTGARTPPGEAPAGEEQRLNAAILDACPAVIYAKDTQGRYILVNRQWEALFHAARDQVKGKTDYDLFPKENAELFRERDRQVLEAGTAMVREERLTPGDELHAYTSLRFPIFGPSKTPWAICGISTEIAERTAELVKANQKLQAEIAQCTQEEQRLLRSAEYYRALIENAMDIVT